VKREQYVASRSPLPVQERPRTLASNHAFHGLRMLLPIGLEHLREDISMPLDVEADAIVSLCQEAFGPASKTTVQVDAERLHSPSQMFFGRAGCGFDQFFSTVGTVFRNRPAER